MDPPKTDLDILEFGKMEEYQGPRYWGISRVSFPKYTVIYLVVRRFGMIPRVSNVAHPVIYLVVYTTHIITRVYNNVLLMTLDISSTDFARG